MSARYKIRLYTPSGVALREFDDVRYIAYEREVNNMGLLQFDINANNTAVPLFELDGQVEVLRTNPAQGIGWYVDFRGLIRDEVVYTNQDNITYVTILAPGDLHWLSRAYVAWTADTANRSKFENVKAETVAKTLVTYNATASATTGNGRVATQGDWKNFITVESDGATGEELDMACAWQPLLNTLQRVSDTGGGDFDLIKTGATSWQFRWYDGQRGVDKSANVRFSRGLDNVVNPVLRRNRMRERTVAIVGGQGEESSRDIVVRTGANYDSTHNHLETFVQASQSSTTSSLNNAGDARLRELEAWDDIQFGVHQTDAIAYGRDYDLGDLVTVRYSGLTQVKKISKISVRWEPVESGGNPERIVVTTSNPPGGA